MGQTPYIVTKYLVSGPSVWESKNIIRTPRNKERTAQRREDAIVSGSLSRRFRWSTRTFWKTRWDSKFHRPLRKIKRTKVSRDVASTPIRHYPLRRLTPTPSLPNTALHRPPAVGRRTSNRRTDTLQSRSVGGRSSLSYGRKVGHIRKKKKKNEWLLRNRSFCKIVFTQEVK